MRYGTLRAAAGVLAAVLAVVAAAGPASASTRYLPGGQRAAAVQQLLDRVLGPGGAFVEIDDLVVSSARAGSIVRYGAAVPTVSQVGTTAAGGWSSQSMVAQHAVGVSASSTVTPPGSVLRQYVTVAVDRARLGTVPLTRVKALVSSAAGVSKARGDRVLVVLVHGLVKAAVPHPPVVPFWRSLPVLAGVAATLLALLVVLTVRLLPARRTVGG